MGDENAEHAKADRYNEVAEEEEHVCNQAQPMNWCEVKNGQNDKELDCESDHAEDDLIPAVRVVAEQQYEPNEVRLEIELFFSDVHSNHDRYCTFDVEQ